MERKTENEITVDFGRTADRIHINADKSVTLQGCGGGMGAKTGLYLFPKHIPKESPSVHAGGYQEWESCDMADTLNVNDISETRVPNVVVISLEGNGSRPSHHGDGYREGGKCTP